MGVDQIPMPENPSYNNYAVDGTVSLIFGELVMATKRFRTRWQRWDAERDFQKLIMPLARQGKVFHFHYNHIEPTDTEIVRPIGTGKKVRK
jgi:hypothetical protein